MFLAAARQVRYTVIDLTEETDLSYDVAAESGDKGSGSSGDSTDISRRELKALEGLAEVEARQSATPLVDDLAASDICEILLPQKAASKVGGQGASGRVESAENGCSPSRKGLRFSFQSSSGEF